MSDELTAKQLLMFRMVRLEDIVREAIYSAIDDNGGNLTDAATQLGISRSTMYRKLGIYKKRNRTESP